MIKKQNTVTVNAAWHRAIFNFSPAGFEDWPLRAVVPIRRSLLSIASIIACSTIPSCRTLSTSRHFPGDWPDASQVPNFNTV